MPTYKKVTGKFSKYLIDLKQHLQELSYSNLYAAYDLSSDTTRLITQIIDFNDIYQRNFKYSSIENKTMTKQI